MERAAFGRPFFWQNSRSTPSPLKYMKPTNLRVALLIVGLLALTAAVYGPGLGGPFLFDDYPNLRMTKLESLDFDSLRDATLSNRSGFLLRPVANLSLALNGYFLGPESVGYKSVNLVFHLIAGLLVFFLVRALALARDGNGNSRANAVALVAAGFWLLHPIQVSTVLYVVQRMAQLSAIFAMLAVLAWLRWRRSLNSAYPLPVWIWIPIAGLLTLLSILSKENGALVPLYLLAIEVTIFRSPTQPGNRRSWLVGNGLSIAAPLLLGVLYVILHWHRLMAGYVTRPFTVGERLLTEIHAVWHYIRLIFLPSLADMGLYVDDFPVQHQLDLVTTLLGLGLLALLALAWILRRRQPMLSLGILWFFAAHAMESTFIALEPVFEHRNYLALLGPALIVGWYVPHLIRKSGSLKRVALAGVAVLGLALPALTAVRANSWSSNLAFLRTQLLHHPGSFRVQIGMLEAALNAENYEGALKSIDMIEQTHPHDAGPAILRVLVSCQTGHVEHVTIEKALDAIATEGVNKKVVLSLNTLTNREIRGDCSAVQSGDAVALMDTALANDGVQHNRRLRGLLLLNRARLHAKFDDVPTAEKDYLAAYQADPDTLTPLYDLFYLHLAVNNFKQARRTLELIRRAVQSSALGVGQSTLRDLEAYYDDHCQRDEACKGAAP